MRILIVEDDITLGDGLTEALRMASNAVDWVKDGAKADRALMQPVHDVVVLDICLPRMMGWEVLRRLRSRKVNIPVLLLTACDAVEDRVRGLDLGADDYLPKPFSLPELEARLRALVRRANGAPFEIQHGFLRFDRAGRRAFLSDQPLDLSARELGILETLLERIGRVVSKDQMVRHLCSWDEELGDNAIEVYIHRLRRKIESSGIVIRTVRGLGYMLEKPSLA